MIRTTFAPPPTAALDPITIPIGLPDIDDVIGPTVIIRLPTALANHAQAAIVGALAAHGQPAIVAALDDHAVHNHPVDLTAAIVDGAGTRIQATAVAGPLGYPGGGPTVPGGVGGVLNNLAAQAHDVNPAPAPVVHNVGANPVVHAGADPRVNATAVKVAERTFTLSVQTFAGDLVSLVYLERGSRLHV